MNSRKAVWLTGCLGNGHLGHFSVADAFRAGGGKWRVNAMGRSVGFAKVELSTSSKTRV